MRCIDAEHRVHVVMPSENINHHTVNPTPREKKARNEK